MKYKIKENDKDALNNLTVKVEYINGDESIEKTLNFDPAKTKTEILERINNSCPLTEKTTEETEKETAYNERKAELDSEIGKETIIEEVKIKEIKE